ncbi:MAG TPA: thioredoxin domain-containing protein [Chloroflexota bacterium]|nr:thioredoxin domain-containing protein [Chloroflexota bacterium]
MPNRLSGERSPYLQQHAHNPVDWYPYGPEAFARAVAEDKPVLISIGYSACHWCHVMERESFEDERTARLMNDLLVSIKVDREERPDVDAVYMEAVQGLTGQGGWPLNVFCTPQGEPFFGGTYFPPEPRHGMPSWPQVVASIARAYHTERQQVLQNAEAVTEYVRSAQQMPQSHELLTPEMIATAYAGLESQFDWTNGGFGGAPKFPQPLGLEFVLRQSGRRPGARDFAALSLQRMAAGGLYDHLGGGFHRYSVDATWTVPHFEKMLYDNALLASLYLHMFQIAGEEEYRDVATGTLDYLLRDLRSPQGAFYSAQDADSEGEEGRYYVWTPQELERVLGPEDAQLIALRFGVTARGNFEGATVLTLAMPVTEVARRVGSPPEAVHARLVEAQRRLLIARDQRVRPPLDSKVLVSWNALAIRALAQAGRVLRRSDYLDAAERAADFILTQMRPGGGLVRSWQGEASRIPAFLEDYSYLVEALVTLAETTGSAGRLDTARALAEAMVTVFWDDEQGAFFDSQVGVVDLIVRPRSFFDNPIPSGNSAATFGLLRLHALTGEDRYLTWAMPAFRSARGLMERAPLAVSYLLSALDFYLEGATQVGIVGDPADPTAQALADTVFRRYLPNAVVAIGPSDSQPLLNGRGLIEGSPAAYVCRHFACDLPVADPESLAAQLEGIRAG